MSTKARLLPLATLPLLACDPSGDSEWVLRLRGATLPGTSCGGSSWDEESGPDPFVEVIANWNGDAWETDWIEDELEPEWGEAVWGGEPATAGDLRDFGIGVIVWDEEGWVYDPEQIGRETYLVQREDFTEPFAVDVECVRVKFELVRD